MRLTVLFLCFFGKIYYCNSSAFVDDGQPLFQYQKLQQEINILCNQTTNILFEQIQQSDQLKTKKIIKNQFNLFYHKFSRLFSSNERREFLLTNGTQYLISKYWAQIIINREAVLKHDGNIEIINYSILDQLFFNKNVKNRFEKIKILCQLNFKEKFAKKIFKSILNNSLKILEEYSDEVFELMFEIESNNTITKWFQDYLKKHHLEFFKILLKSKNILQIKKFIDLIFKYQIDIFLYKQEYITNRNQHISSPLLEIVSNQMFLYKKTMIKDHILSSHLEQTLNKDSFRKDLLDSNYCDTVKQYIRLGIVRNYFLAQIGKNLLPKIIDNKEDAKYFSKVITYLNQKDFKLQELLLYRGAKNLLLIDKRSEVNLLYKAVKDLNSDALELMVFLLTSPLDFEEIKIFSNGNNLLHVAALSEFFDFETNQEINGIEEKIIKILRIFMYSNRFKIDQVVNLIIQKNDFGDTPFFLTAKFGLYKSFQTIKEFLLVDLNYNQNDHHTLFELKRFLLSGIAHRINAYPSRKLKKVYLNLSKELKKYKHLNKYCSSDKKCVKSISSIILKISIFLKLHRNSKNRILKNAYQNAFKLLMKHFKNNKYFKSFNRAPLSVQMSYIEKPLSIICDYIILDFPKKFLNTQQIYNLICNSYSCFITFHQERAIKEIIEKKLKLTKERQNESVHH